MGTDAQKCSPDNPLYNERGPLFPASCLLHYRSLSPYTPPPLQTTSDHLMHRSLAATCLISLGGGFLTEFVVVVNYEVSNGFLIPWNVPCTHTQVQTVCAFLTREFIVLLSLSADYMWVFAHALPSLGTDPKESSQSSQLAIRQRKFRSVYVYGCVCLLIILTALMYLSLCRMKSYNVFGGSSFVRMLQTISCCMKRKDVDTHKPSKRHSWQLTFFYWCHSFFHPYRLFPEAFSLTTLFFLSTFPHGTK